MINTCKVVAIEGSHGTGKSTLVHALAGALKERGVLVGAHLETARENPIIEATRIHEFGTVDIFGQLSLFGDKLSQEARQARFNHVMIADKTIMNVLGYARLLLSVEDSLAQPVLASLSDFCRAYASVYDVVFCANDLYDLAASPDPFRPIDSEFQAAAARSIRQTLEDAACPVVDIPQGLSLSGRVEFVVSHPSVRQILDALP